MSGMYKEGDHFGLHTDTGLYYNKKNKEKSRYTYLLYLNDNFDGGETIFYNDLGNIIKTIKPEKGKLLIFDIDLWHKGNSVYNGNKFWIGIEIIAEFERI